MKNVMKKICALVLAAAILCCFPPAMAQAGYQISGMYLVQTESGVPYAVKTLDYAYENNTYFSLRDIAMVLKGTDKAFSLEVTKNSIALNPGGAYTPVGVENIPWEDGGSPELSLKRNELKVGGQSVRYYTMIMKLPSGVYDCFMMAADLAMILDMNIAVPGSGCLEIHTQESFRISPFELEAAGYFTGVNSVVIGDATTGEIYYQYQADIPFPLASTTKLMTSLLAMDAISLGLISRQDVVTISEAAHVLSGSGDGVVPLEAGGQITVQDLLVGTLVPSSNECALCLAETIAGSEEAFVALMNQKAQDLGLSQALFYNCHGLPFYTEDPIPAKCQNHMSAEEMFRMASHILRVYPQIKDITSLKRATLGSIGVEVRNTNPLLHNMPEVTGLKTGTTNRAGACLVTSLSADNGNGPHDLVVVVLGTEDSIERGRVSALMAHYALQVFYEGPGEEAPAQTVLNAPAQAEEAVDCVIRTARSRQSAAEVEDPAAGESACSGVGLTLSMYDKAARPVRQGREFAIDICNIVCYAVQM